MITCPRNGLPQIRYLSQQLFIDQLSLLVHLLVHLPGPVQNTHISRDTFMSCYVVILCSFKYKRSSISTLRFQIVWFDFLLSGTSNYHEIKISNHIYVFSAWSCKQTLPRNEKTINDKSNGFSWGFRRDKPTLGVCMGKTIVNSYSIGSKVITDLSSTVKIITNWNFKKVFVSMISWYTT